MDGMSLQVRHSLRCLIPQNYSLDNNVQIEQYYCGSFNAYWEFVTMTDGYYRIRYKGTNRCMAVSGASTENLARVLVATCAGAYTNDQWKPINRTSELGVDWYLLYNRHSGRCMNIRGGSTTEGTDVIQYTCDSTAKHERFTWSYWPL